MDHGYPSHPKCSCYKNRDQTSLLPATWKHVVSVVTKSMYRSTAIGLATPIPHLGLSGLCEYCQQQRHKYNFNTDHFASKDASHYRQQRSEHLLFRVYHTIPLEFDDINVLRIDKGVFVAQQTRKTTPKSTPSLLIDSMDVTPTVPSSYNCFLHYTYTIGARYTNLGGQRGDYLIRGWIPLWCQALILFGIYSADPPIVSHETRLGLIPFAPHLPLTFIPFLDHPFEEDPQVLLWYERFAMDNDEDRQGILNKLVYCPIPHGQAHLITALGNAWAMNEGYSLD